MIRGPPPRIWILMAASLPIKVNVIGEREVQLQQSPHPFAAFTNLGDPVSSWDVQWTFAGGQQVTRHAEELTFGFGHRAVDVQAGRREHQHDDRDAAELQRQAVATQGADAVVVHKGSVRHISPERFAAIG